MLLFKSTATRTLLVGHAAYSSLADKCVKYIDKKCSKCSLEIFPIIQNNEMVYFKNEYKVKTVGLSKLVVAQNTMRAVSEPKQNVQVVKLNQLKESKLCTAGENGASLWVLHFAQHLWLPLVL